MGGYGTAFGAVIGSAFLEVIRNALLMAGIDSNWQGAFVGMFIVIAVLVGMQTSGTSLLATIRDRGPQGCQRCFESRASFSTHARGRARG